MTATDAMESVSEIAHGGALEQRATLNALSDAKKRDGATWSFQLLSVTDDRIQKWFFRHNEPYDKLQSRILVTQSKQNESDAAKGGRWGAYNARCKDYQTGGSLYGAATSSGKSAQWGDGQQYSKLADKAVTLLLGVHTTTSHGIHGRHSDGYSVIGVEGATPVPTGARSVDVGLHL